MPDEDIRAAAQSQQASNDLHAFCRTHKLNFLSTHITEGEELRGFQLQLKRGYEVVSLGSGKKFEEAVKKAISQYEVENVII